jgi:IS5 family transposase
MRTNRKPLSFADISKQARYKQTKAGTFLERANEVIDFSFTDTIFKKLFNGEVGRKPYDSRLMFRILLLQQWYGLSDAQAEEQIYDRESYKEFLGINMDDYIPDETTICNFRNALVKHNLEELFFDEVQRQLFANGVAIRKGRIIDATIVETPKGRKDKETGGNSRDTEAGFTKKNGKTYHGYKGHTATDTKGNFIMKVFVSTATDHDSIHKDKLLTGDEDAVFGDSAYINKEMKKAFRKQGKFYGMVERATRNHPLSSSQKKRNRKLSSVRCRVEHVFAELKCRMNYKPRYRGLKKNTWQYMMATATYNLKRLIGTKYKSQKQALTWCT